MENKGFKKFVSRWSGDHREEEDARSFLIDLFQNILRQDYATDRIQFEKKVRIKGHLKKMDAYIPETKTVIEFKSSHVDLDHTGRKDYPSAFEQAKAYYDNLPASERGQWIVVSNFKEVRLYDMEHPWEDPYVVYLNDPPKKWQALEVLSDPKYSIELQKIIQEQKLSVKAGELVGILYHLFLKQFDEKPSEQQQKDLNILIVRIVFCLYAEDAGLFETNQFHDFLQEYSWQNVNRGLKDLFEVLNTPEAERDPYCLTESLNKFPYVNGGLFKAKINIPRFTAEIVQNILKTMSEQFNWSGISPTIFGAAFESTLNPETRRSGGMHYTSIENIHKVIDPLFLDDLKSELDEIRTLKQPELRSRRAAVFQKKLGSIKILDPACGSGNFLTESYLSLRELENEAIRLQMKDNEIRMDMALIEVHIQNFYGIEINDFAVSVATTALYIAEAQMFRVTQQIVYGVDSFLPLHSYENIREANALRIDWNTVIPRSEVTYIIGNPPFSGFSYMSPDQKLDMSIIFPGIKNLDYVCAWFKKANDYILGTDIQCALVSTNSISQGETVSRLFETLNFQIDFAYPSFVWNNQAKNQAHVHCVILGFSWKGRNKRYLYFQDEVKQVTQISPYLTDGPNILVKSTNVPLCGQHQMVYGNKPADGGHLIIEDKDFKSILNSDPLLQQFIRPLLGAAEFLNNKKRWCFWLVDIEPSELAKHPILMERIKKTRQARLDSKAAGIRKFATTPTKFAQITQPPNTTNIIIPRTSSERREYIPMDFRSSKFIVTDAVQLIPKGTIYDFGLISSSVHMAWMRTVAGRLKSDYRYSKDIVYNTFPWPLANEIQKEKIRSTAQNILDIRAKYPSSSLADLYDQLLMPADLRKAHEENDRAVLEAYGLPVDSTESQIVSHLMILYEKLTK